MTPEQEKDIDLIVWDLETTGFVAPECKILEIGAFLVRNGEVEKKHWVFQNNCEIPEKITEITGITKDIIDAEGTDPRTNLSEFLPLFKRAKQNCTHNGLRFDIPFLLTYSADLFKYSDDEWQELKDLLENTAYDTAVHFKGAKLDMGQMDHESYLEFGKRVMDTRAYGVKYSLGLCAEEMKIDVTNIVAHRALADVHVTYELFKKIHGLKSEPVNEDVPF